MARGRRPKPRILHELAGTVNVTRHRTRDQEPLAPGELADLPPPADLDKLQRERWKLAVAHMPRAMLRTVDAGLLRIYCVLEALSITANKMQAAIDAKTSLPLIVRGVRGQHVLSPYVKLQLRAAPALARIAAEIGFSPASRASLSVDQDAGNGEDDRWDWLMRTATPAQPSKALGQKLASAALAETEPEAEA
jgi:phage terminase small subunit